MENTVTRIMAGMLSLFLVLAVGCQGEMGDDNADAGTADAGGGEVSLQFVSPAADSVHVRDFVGEFGALVALVNLEVSASGPIARIGFQLPGGEALGNAGEDMILPAQFHTDGAFTVTARAYGHDGEIAATDTLQLTITAPEADDCYDWLDLYGVDYTLGPSRMGIADPVTVNLPLNGVAYRYISYQSPRDTMLMDCKLAAALARGAYHMRKRDIIELVDIGVYNYRCIGGGTPPDCTLSQHAYATAIDIAGFTVGDGTYYSVLDDWVIDPGDEATCDTATESDKDRFLHEIICEMKADDIWNIVLTPNYNEAHRDHFHVDLTPGSDYIKSLGGVDQGPDGH